MPAGHMQRARDAAHQQQIRVQSLQAEQRAAQSNLERVKQQSDQFKMVVSRNWIRVNGADDPIADLETELQALLQQRNLRMSRS